MSYHHENVLWQSPDGTWNRGFFARDYLSCGGSDDCDEAPEHEWCQEFDQTSFEWVSTGHPTQEAAHRSWDGSNPGSVTVHEHRDDPDHVQQIAEFEDIAAKRYERARQQAADHRDRQGGLYSSGNFYSITSPGYWGYHGPPKQRSLPSIKRERDAFVESWAATHAAGYDNGRQVDQERRLDDQIADRLRDASPVDLEAFENADAEHRNRLRAGLEERRAHRRDQNRRDSRYSYGISQSHLARSRRLAEREAEIEALISQADEAAAHRIATRTPPAPATQTNSPATTGPVTQRRQPKGVPVGGQFATSQRAEPDVTLDKPWG